MKFATVSKGLALGVALLLASSAFAGTKASLHLDSPAILNGTTLKPGDYKLEWEGAGPTVELRVIRGKTVVATVTARVIELHTPQAYNAALTRKNDGGPNSLVGIAFRDKTFALQVEGTNWNW
jgi:hypothetical protein